MHDQVGFDLFDQGEHAFPIANIESLVPIAGNLAAQVVQHRARVAFRSEEDRAMIAINSGNPEALLRKEQRYLRANQPAGTCDKERWSRHSDRLSRWNR